MITGRGDRVLEAALFGFSQLVYIAFPKGRGNPIFSLWKSIFSQTNGLNSTWNFISGPLFTPKSPPNLTIINNLLLLDCFTDCIIIKPPLSPKRKLLLSLEVKTRRCGVKKGGTYDSLKVSHQLWTLLSSPWGHGRAAGQFLDEGNPAAAVMTVVETAGGGAEKVRVFFKKVI